MESVPQVYFRAECVCPCPGCRPCSSHLLRTDPTVMKGGGQPGHLLCNLPPSEKRGFPSAYFQQRIRDNEVLPWERHLDFCVIFQEGLSVLPRKHVFLNHGIKVIIPWNKVMGRLLVQEISDLKVRQASICPSFSGKGSERDRPLACTWSDLTSLFSLGSVWK